MGVVIHGHVTAAGNQEGNQSCNKVFHHGDLRYALEVRLDRPAAPKLHALFGKWPGRDFLRRRDRTGEYVAVRLKSYAGFTAGSVR